MLKMLKIDCLLSIYLFIVAREISKLVTEFGSFGPGFSLDFACECFEFVNVFRANVFLNCEQLEIERLLVGFLEEGNEEL